MQRCENLVNLEKRCKMNIWTQKSALIQLRTSLLKFDDLAEKSEKSSVSNFSIKAGVAGNEAIPVVVTEDAPDLSHRLLRPSKAHADSSSSAKTLTKNCSSTS